MKTLLRFGIVLAVVVLACGMASAAESNPFIGRWALVLPGNGRMAGIHQ
ncbi:MAG: hypothetical protein NTU83_06150 [Candidatus Hydrogenedentes bacterium]|nr:hypothetical protein [Candidatus Hydrogenedentota bacterium]